MKIQLDSNFEDQNAGNKTLETKVSIQIYFRHKKSQVNYLAQILVTNFLTDYFRFLMHSHFFNELRHGVEE